MGLFNLKGFPGKGTFRHGIHPPDKKEFSAERPVECMPFPDRVVLPLLQHIGAPCQPIVKPKDEVRFGQLIGVGKSFVSASLHSPFAGKVQKISSITLPNGRHLPAIHIKKEGEQVSCDKLWKDMLLTDWPNDCISIYDAETISKIIHDSGVVGLGGAAFPTHVKVIPDDKKLIDTLIVNGCECEPYLTPDYRMMVELPGAVVTGALLAGRAVAAREIIICVEDNKPRAIAKLKKATQQTVIKIAVVKTKYPQGSEKQLIKAVLDLDVPLGGLPSDIGVAMSNVGTMATIARGVIREEPLTHRVISVSGGGIAQPKNLFVPIGISMGEVIDFCGGVTADAARIIAGGPMMGFAFSNLDTPVVKGSGGITVLTHDEIATENETACVRCGRCVDACPMNLVPTRLAMAARYNTPGLADRYNITACFECGSCSYVCPANIRLVQLIRTGKAQVAAARQGQ